MVIVVMTRNHYIPRAQVFKERESLKARQPADQDEE